MFIDYNYFLNLSIMPKIVFSFLTLFLGRLFFIIFLFFAKKKILDESRLFAVRRILSRFLLFLALLFLIVIWTEGWSSLGTIIGFLSAGIVLALKEEIISIMSWFKIIFGTLFKIGDRIEINNIKGDVVSIDFLHFSVLEIKKDDLGKELSTGRIVHIPNSQVVFFPIFNYSIALGFIWQEVNIVVSLKSDWQKAKDILNTIGKKYCNASEGQARKRLKKVYKSYLIKYKTLSPIVLTQIVPVGVQLTLRYLASPKQNRFLESQITEEILKQFKKHNISLA